MIYKYFTHCAFFVLFYKNQYKNKIFTYNILCQNSHVTNVGFFTNRKADFERHLKTRKHLGNTECNTKSMDLGNTKPRILVTQKYITKSIMTLNNSIIDNDTGSMIICEKCNKQFKHKSTRIIDIERNIVKEAIYLQKKRMQL